MKRLALIIPSLCFMLPLHADTTEAVSGVFEFDVRDSAGTTEAVSGVFGVDARNLGNSASSASGVFALGTQSGSLDALVIDAIHAPGSVLSGQPYAFPVLASFAGSGGSLIDVSTDAKWFIVGDSPAGTRFEGNRLTAGKVTVATVIRVAAAFSFPSGIRETVPREVTILPAIPGYKVLAVYSAVRPWNDNWYRLTCNAATDSPQGAAQAQNVLWDLDQDGDFDDATGLQAVRDYLAGQTVRIGVRAQWIDPLSLAVMVASNYFFVTFEKPSVAGEPPRGKALDGVNGAFLDSSGALFVPAAARKDNGLVILTHGLHGAGSNDWLGKMRDAISSRLVAAPPNVAIYDWQTMADAGGDGEELSFEDVIKIRANGKAQGIVLADWVEAQRLLGRVDRNAKIHLIGHSAGGFVMGEATRILSQRFYSQIQVTMLDTPLPYHEHIKPTWRTERYISSFLGGNPKEHWQANAWNNAAILAGSAVDHFIVPKGATGQGLLVNWLTSWASGQGIRLKTLVNPGSRYYRAVIDPRVEGILDQHSAAYQYYLATINDYQQSISDWRGEVLGDGFNQSLLVNDADFAPSPQVPSAARMALQVMAAPTLPMEDFLTFGEVQQTGSIYRVSEAANAGIFKNLTLPIGATTLQFQLQVTTPGDGDFVSVHWNDGDALAIIPETALAYEAPLLHEIDLTGLGGQTGTLTLKLISRGVANSVVEFSEIRILESDEADGDGLTNEEESAVGSDAFNLDSDDDSLTDGEEVNIHGTCPVKGDSDGDGQNDASELASGTAPLTPQSRFAAAMGPVLPGVSAAVHWNGVAGRNYRVVRTQELGTLNMDFLKGGLEGVSGPMTYEDPNPPPLKAFYWIEVE